MIVSIIVAIARNRVIGRAGTLPWHLPDELRYFRRITLGKPVVMGRKTYESIGKPLPGRTTVIVTRDANYQVKGCLTAASIDAAIAACGEDAEVFFVGGADLYAQVLARADRLYLTEIQADYQGDAHFPEFDRDSWTETARQVHISQDGLGYHFVTYQRCAAPLVPGENGYS